MTVYATCIHVMMPYHFCHHLNHLNLVVFFYWHLMSYNIAYFTVISAHLYVVRTFTVPLRICWKCKMWLFKRSSLDQLASQTESWLRLSSIFSMFSRDAARKQCLAGSSSNDDIYESRSQQRINFTPKLSFLRMHLTNINNSNPNPAIYLSQYLSNLCPGTHGEIMVVA